MEYIDINEPVLQHYGVLGMKWGKHKLKKIGDRGDRLTMRINEYHRHGLKKYSIEAENEYDRKVARKYNKMANKMSKRNERLKTKGKESTVYDKEMDKAINTGLQTLKAQQKKQKGSDTLAKDSLTKREYKKIDRMSRNIKRNGSIDGIMISPLSTSYKKGKRYSKYKRKQLRDVLAYRAVAAKTYK